MRDLDDRVAIVTGAARGQGEAEARLLAERGASVVITDVLTEQGAAVAADIGERALFVSHDVSSATGWAAVVTATLERFGRIDVLVNNAAIAPVLDLEETDPDGYDRVYRVNQLGVFLGMRAVVGPMKDIGGGSIINISSIAGVRAASNMFAYSATKWAVRGMSKSAALSLARYKIRVNVILPGAIDTPMLDGTPPGMNAALVQATPLGRLGLSAEVAEAVCFLASDKSSFVTGVDFPVDGGMSA